MPRIVDGALEYVLTIGGQAFERFTCRKSAFAALVTAMTLSGCATCREHPAMCGVAAIFAAGCIDASLPHSSVHRHDIALNPPSCADGGCR